MYKRVLNGGTRGSLFWHLFEVIDCSFIPSTYGLYNNGDKLNSGSTSLPFFPSSSSSSASVSIWCCGKRKRALWSVAGSVGVLLQDPFDVPLSRSFYFDSHCNTWGRDNHKPRIRSNLDSGNLRRSWTKSGPLSSHYSREGQAVKGVPPGQLRRILLE